MNSSLSSAKGAKERKLLFLNPMPRENMVAAIILNYNGGSMILDCIESLLSGSVIPQVIVVDNASTDGSVASIRSRFPGIAVIQNKENLGFAAGMNIGLRKAMAEGKDFFWLLNNDCLVEKTTLENLLLVARDHLEQGLWSPAIYMLDGTKPWFLGGDISYLTMRAKHKKSANTTLPFESTNYLTGCALLLSKKVVEKCGYLDDRYFLYYEDAAYSITARKKGFIPTVVFQSHLRHAEKSSTNPDKVYWLVRSGVIFFRHESPWYWRPWIISYLFLRKIRNSLDIALNPTPIARRVKQAYTDAS